MPSFAQTWGNTRPEWCGGTKYSPGGLAWLQTLALPQTDPGTFSNQLHSLELGFLICEMGTLITPTRRVLGRADELKHAAWSIMPGTQ